MLEAMAQQAAAARGADDIWRALANPSRRRLLDALRSGPRTTGDLAAALPELSRFAVMQHLNVLVDAGLVLVRRRGRHRFNHLNPVPLRRAYERWVNRFADVAAAEALALGRHMEEQPMPVATDEQVRVVRIETEIRFRAAPERVFRALTDGDEVRQWYPHTYGGDRVQRVVLEQRVGGAQFEDWGDGRGHVYGQVLEWDPPRRQVVRSRLMPGTVFDTVTTVEPDAAGSVLRQSKVIVGPLSDEDVEGIAFHGDLARYEDALRAVIEREPA